MEFEPRYIEEQLDKDYFGAGGRINGLGFRVKDNEFSKSLQLEEVGEEEEYYYDENGVRHRKKDITELSSINVEEISLVDRPCVKKWTVVKNLEDKGDGEVKKSDFRWSGNVERIIRGYSDEDLEECDYEEEIEKSSNTNPFPSLAHIFSRNKRVLEEVYELATVEDRAI